jgi:hypothetical protein
MFVAADSLEDDGGTVKLDIGIVESSNEKVKHKTIDTSWQKIKAELDKFYAAKRGNNCAKIKKVQDGTCHNGGLNSDKKTEATVQTNNGIEILYPNKDSQDEHITSEPKMPVVPCRARLKNYTGGTVKFRWAYWLTASLERKKRNCPRFSKSYFKGYSYAENTNTTYWTVPFIKDSAYFWFESVYQEEVPDILQGIYGGKGYGCGKHTTIYEGGNNVFTGGKIWVKVTAFDVNGNQIGCGCLDHGELIGDNPQPEQVKQYVKLHQNWQELYAIVLCESTGNQFEVSQDTTYLTYKIGWPRYGPKNGYGLMQLDNYPSPTEEQVWNWKSNVEGGIAKYLLCKNMATADYDTPHTADNDKHLLINAFQYYNENCKRYLCHKLRNGTYKWDDNPKCKRPNYGINVYNKYLELKSEN